ncbi:hypothetical protein L1987_03932 [Smallanthus sonchifolius]|uniref:Uncharacterized protein n=1 Tax=Smallanthus sonchifolius TaxID=185202 RepID=A0ACB9KC30_9ASTR|nr:hypothetical protein L1987_03932 [Smallanthus sonchifolius]
MQNLQINHPNQPPNSGAGPRGPVLPFGPSRPEPPSPGAVPRGAVSSPTGPAQGTLPPFMAPNRAPGGGGPPPTLASRPMASGPLPSSTTSAPGPRPCPFAGPPNVGGCPVGMVVSRPCMGTAVHGSNLQIVW